MNVAIIMKNILLLSLLAISVNCAGQGADLWRYADLSYPLSGFSSKANVVVDYGVAISGWFRVPEMLEDSTGKAIKFKSPVDALNWMSERSWELVQSYQTEESIGLGGALKYQHFIMRRRDVAK